MKLKILAIVALAAVGIGAAFVAVGGLPSSAASTTQYLTGAVTTGDVTDEVAATGTVAASVAMASRSARPLISRARPRTARLDALDRYGPEGGGRPHGQEGRRPRHRRHDRAQAAISPMRRTTLAGAKIRRTIAEEDLADASTTAAKIRQAKIERLRRANRGLECREVAGRPGDEGRARDACRADRRGRDDRQHRGRASRRRPATAIVIDAATFEVTPTSSRATSPRWPSARPRRSRSARSTPTSTGTVIGDRPGGGRRQRPAASCRTRSPSRSATRPATVRAGMTADVTITIDERDERPDGAGRGPARHDRRLHASWSSAPTARRPPSPSRSGS